MAKTIDAPVPSCVASDLISLLAELNGGEPLELTVLAAVNSSFVPSTSALAPTSPPKEVIDCVLNNLFQAHVGTSSEIIINNAIQFYDAFVDVESNLFNELEMRGGSSYACYNRANAYFNHPTNRMIKGPKPNGRVWLELFMGGEHVQALLEGTFPLRELHDKAHDVPAEEDLILKTLKNDVTKLPMNELLFNILSYVRSKSKECNPDELLRFAVMYGLDGVMKDVVNGAYGLWRYVDGLNIDMPLPFSTVGSPHGMEVDIPAMFFGAMLGYSNIVLTAINDLNAEIDAPCLFNNEMIEHYSPSFVLEWVILKNMKDVLKTLVNDGGFQFRWLSQDFLGDDFVDRIFGVAAYESDPRWKGSVEEEDYAYEGSRVRCKMRASSAYEEQMKMLDYLIELGFPFALLFPTEPKVEGLERLQKKAKKMSRPQKEESMRSLSKDEKRANKKIAKMCCGYNGLQRSEAKMFTVCDYYRLLKKKWEGKESQVARLPEYEALDMTWREERRQRQGGGGSEDDYSDDDADSYASGL